MTEEQREALREIVSDWISEGFTTPPYTEAQYDLFESLELDRTSTIVHGRAANGADKIAHQEAEKLGLRVEPHPANWAKYGKSAGFVRNKEMVDIGADLCIAFWDGKSNGTKHTMDLAEAAGIPVEVIE